MMYSLRLLNRCYRNKVNNESVRYMKQKINPGLNKRSKAILGDKANDELDNIDYDLDELESDFMNVHLTHKEHVQQMNVLNEKTRYHVVKQKYFKEKCPNFLTWHDKEQMRYLHKTDPEEWTIEKLAEGFPASPDVVVKIVKSNWTKNNEIKIKKHDITVQKNWKLLKNGKLDNLPQQLKEHLEKFTSRELNFQKFQPPQEKNKMTVVHLKQTNKSGDFSEIITSYEKLKQSNCENSNKLEITADDKNYISNNTIEENALSHFKGQHVTLESLKGNIENKIMKGGQVSENDKFILQELSQKSQDVCEVIEIKDEDLTEVPKQKFNVVSNYVTKTQKDVTHLLYPEKIMIPKKVLKRGGTYKLNDCYYDHDGEFLYRVPGMMK